MLNSIIKVSSTITAAATTDSDVSVDIPEDAGLWSIDGFIFCTGITGGVAAATLYQLKAELSFLSTNQFNSNDARGCLLELALSFYTENADNAASGIGAKTSQIHGKDFMKPIPVYAGERIHVHTHSSIAGLVGQFSFLLYLQTKGGGRRDCRRR